MLAVQMLTEQKSIFDQVTNDVVGSLWNYWACAMQDELNCFNKYFLNIHIILVVIRDDHDYIHDDGIQKNLKI